MHIFDATPLSITSCSFNDIRTLQFLGRAFHGGPLDMVAIVHLDTEALEELKSLVNRHRPEEDKENENDVSYNQAPS